MKDYGQLRIHQRQAIEVALGILSGTVTDHVIVASVTPGGGKTLMAALFADVLFDACDIEQVIVVVPNKPLAQQMRSGFHNPSRGLHRFLGDRKSRGGRALPGMGIPCGRVVTYQSIHSDPSYCLRRVKKKRTLLILDEPHHLADNKAWALAIEPIVQSAHRVLMMSGTLTRGDGARIPFIHYDADQRARTHIRYSRREALSEKAVLSINVKSHNGKSFYEYRGKPKGYELSTAPKKEQARTLKTALLTPNYVDPLVQEAMRDWSVYRREKYNSKAIVVAHSKIAARRLANVVSRSFPEANTVLVLHDEPRADQNIREFRLGHANVMVTVKKAYEGLDVPSATHLVYLGDVRTFGFLDQVIARVTRVNHECGLSWEEQEARVFVPDDARTCDYLDRLLEEQEEVAEPKETEAGQGTARQHSTFAPEDAHHTEARYTLNDLAMDAEECRLLETSRRSSPAFAAMPLAHQIRVVRALKREVPANGH